MATIQESRPDVVKGAAGKDVPKLTNIKIKVESEIAWVALDRQGEKLNTLGTAVMGDIDSMLTWFEGLRGSDRPKLIMLTSAKPGSFIAGADIKEIENFRDAQEAASLVSRGQSLVNRLEDLKIPSIALIDGPALGGGCEVALACDWRICTDNPKTSIGLPEVGLGVMPGFGGSWRFPKLSGLSKSLPLMLAAKPVSGEQATKIGLCDLCVPAAFLEDRARDFAKSHMRKRGNYKKKNKAPLFVRFATWIADKTFFGKLLVLGAAQRETIRKAGRGYPAPLELIACLRKGVLAGRTAYLKQECESFVKLALTEESKHLIRLFFLSEKAKKAPLPGQKKDVETKEISRAGVLGAGVMGGKIAWLFSKNSYPVTLKDISWDAIAKGLASAREVWDEVAKRGRSDERLKSLAMHRIAGSLDYEGLRHDDIVIEAVVENLDVKRKVLAELEAVASKDAIIVSNTSSLSLAAMAQGLKHPDRFAGMHFFNPVNRMPLVEVIAGPKTSDSVLVTVYKTAQKLGKVPVLVRDGPGFLVNRLLMPYLLEASIMMEEGWDIVALDKLIKDWGMPMGPATLMDEVGLDVGWKVAKVLSEGLGERVMLPKSLEKLYHDQKLLGKKGGAGFYLYKKGRKAGVNPVAKQALANEAHNKPSTASRNKETAIDRCFLLMVNEAARCLADGIVADAPSCDLALIMGTGFPAFRGGLLAWADKVGINHVRDRLNALAKECGPRFTPSSLIEELAKKNQGFYKAYPGV